MANPSVRIFGYPKNTISLVYYSADSPQISYNNMWNAIASIAGSLVGAGASLIANKQRNEAQKRESELAYQRQKEAIREQNAYNSASAQMARLQAAGLNPNLMYANGQQASAGEQTAVPEYTPAEITSGMAQAGSFGAEAITSMIGLKDVENQTAMTKAEIAFKSIVGLREMATTQKTVQETENLLQLWGFNENMNPVLISQKYAEIGKALAETGNINKLTEKYGKEIEKIDYDIETMKKSWQLTDAQIENLKANTKLSEAEVYKMLTLLEPEREKIYAEIDKLVSGKELDYANCQSALANSDYLRNKTWEVGQRLMLDRENMERNYGFQYSQLAERKREFDRYNTRAWVQYGTDTLFKAGDFVVELLPMLKKPNPIGFGK